MVVKVHSKEASESPESKEAGRGNGRVRSPKPGPFWVSQVSGSVSLDFSFSIWRMGMIILAPYFYGPTRLHLEEVAELGCRQ